VTIILECQLSKSSLESNICALSLVRQVIFVVRNLANFDSGAVYAHVDRIYRTSVAAQQLDGVLAIVLDILGKAPVPGAAVKCTQLLCQLLSEPVTRPMTIPMVLCYITQQIKVHEDKSVLLPFMPVIRSKLAAHGQMEGFDDWYEGRSLKTTTQKVDALELRVNELNDEFKKCSSVEAVSALMDKKIAELKEFVGQMVKKLPQPVKLEVVGGVRKALVLHFACARTGKTVTTETR